MVTVSPTFGEDGAKDIVSSPLQTGVFVAVGVDVGVDDGIVVGTDVGVAVEVDVETTVGVSIGMEVAVGDGVVVDVDVGACVGVVVATAVGVSVGVGVSAGVAVAVEVDVGGGVKVGVDMGVDVGVGVLIGSDKAVLVSDHSLAVGESPLYTTPATQIDKTTAIEMKRATVRNVFLGKSISLMIPHFNNASYGSDDRHLFAGYSILISLDRPLRRKSSPCRLSPRAVSPVNFCLVSTLGLLLIIKALGKAIMIKHCENGLT